MKIVVGFLYPPLNYCFVLLAIILLFIIYERLNKGKERKASYKKIERELSGIKEELQEIFDNADAAFWSKDLNTGELTVSLGMERIFGVPRNGFQSEIWKEMIHPEDVDMVTGSLEKVQHQPVKFEYRIKKENQEICWVHASNTPIQDENGHTFKIMGVLIDITERKLMEEKLRESEESYRTLQESLDHFSQDLFKVMKISDLENRLILELEEIFSLKNIYILEIDDRLNLYRSTGGSTDFHESVLEYYDQTVQIGEMMKINHGCIIKIGETNGRIILLCMENSTNIVDQLPQRIWLQTISRYVSVLYENLFTIEDLAKELELRSQDKSTPQWILRLLFLVAEKERMRLSADLHDSVLQNQILWYRKLESLRSNLDSQSLVGSELRTLEKGMLDLIQQTRATCNNLRPPYLKEQGLIKALESLFSHTRLNVNYQIEFDYENLHEQLSEEEMIALYRIAQELLANARKHSFAQKVEFKISSIHNCIYFSYEDDGVGMDSYQTIDSFDHIGLNGIKKRVDSIDGEMELYSSPGKGVTLLISIPIKEAKPTNTMLFEVFK